METLQKDSDNKKEFDDSGVQDVGKQAELEDRPAELLDLSDDVLLCILKYCSPMDLKALGFTCPRLGRLIRDRTLWTRVDARSVRTGRARMRWLLAHALGANTVELKIQGYALAARGCLGHVNRKRKEAEEVIRDEERLMREAQGIDEPPTASSSEPGRSQDVPQLIPEVDPLVRLQRLYAQSRYTCTPTWPEDVPNDVDPEDVVLLDGSCPGPQFTLSQCMLRQLRLHCALTSLALDYCNINCNTTGINHFPPTLKKLSLKGTKCYNLPLDRSFLFNIQDYLPEIEHLDLSECEWLEPASLLPLSKVTNLKHLIMKECYRLSEFVAYASLATRYGFRKLEILDVRGSPVADSEVSAFGWLPALQELYVSPCESPAQRPPPRDHSHYRDEPLPEHVELEPWEVEEPEYFKIKPQTIEPIKSRADMTIEEIEQLREYENNLCLHGLEYNLCTEGAWYRHKTHRKRPADDQDKTDDSPTRESNPVSPKVIEVSLRGCPGQRTAHTIRVLPSPQRRLRDQFDEPESSKRVKFTMEASSSKVELSTSTDDDAKANSEVGSSKSFKTEELPTCSKDIDSDMNEETTDTSKKNEKTVLISMKRSFEAKAGSSKDVASDDDTKATSDVGSSKSFKIEELPSPKDIDDLNEDIKNTDTSKKNEKTVLISMKRSFQTRAGSSKDAATNTACALPSFFKEGGLSKKMKTDNSGSTIEDEKPGCSNNEDNTTKIENDKPGCSKDTNNPTKSKNPDDSDSKSHNMNDGASTSKEDTNEPKTSDDCHKPSEHSKGCKCKNSHKYEYVRFRQNMDPVIVRRDPAEVEREERERNNENREVRPRAHVLYVNVGQQLHTVYRLSIHNEPPIFYSFAGNSHLRFRPSVGNLFYNPPTPHLDATSLVSDSAVRRFGRSDVDDINVVHIGPRIGAGDPGSRPNRSSLRTLSITGFRNITDRSLVHLATAAPELRFIDFSETRVTAQGVENFKSLRPDCEVKFSPYVEKEE